MAVAWIEHHANQELFYPTSDSASSLPNVGLCFCFFTRLRLSSRCTGGGAPMAVRAMDFTALVAVNFFFLRFLGTDNRFNHEGHEGSRRIASCFSACSQLRVPLCPLWLI